MDNNSLIRETLTKLEQTQIKLQSILEAQKAMESNIPYFFENNLNALKKFFPNLYKTFKDYKLKNNYKLTCGANGEPNILLPSGNLFYGDSPFNDCKKQVNDFLKNQRASFLSYIGIGQEKDQYHQMHYFYKNKLFEQANDIIKNYKQKNVRDTKNELESVPLMIMYGLGLGYHLSYLYEAFTPINLYIIEPDKDLFYLSLCVFDYASLIEYISNRNLGLKLIIDENENSVFRDLTIYTYRYSMNLAVKSFYTHYYSPSLKRIANLIKSEDSSFTIKNGFFDDTLIGMSHSYQNISNGVKLLSNKKLPEKYTSIPILVVGSGPSLDYDLEFIKKINNKVCILACGTALTSLVKYGIMPNFYVAVERTPEVFDNSLGLIENTSIFDNVICFAPDVVHPNTIAKFKYKFLGLKTNEVMAIALKSLPNIPNAKNSVSLSHINPLVSNMGIVIATLLGFKNIYFVGIDNGSAFKEAHSIYSCYYDENHMLTPGPEGWATVRYIMKSAKEPYTREMYYDENDEPYYGDLTVEQRNHESETSLNGYQTTYTIRNDGSLEDFQKKTEEIIKQIVS